MPWTNPASRSGRWCVVLDEKNGEAFDAVNDPAFSPDGKTLAYAAMKADKWIVVFGDQKGPAFDGVGNPVFSPDGGRVAFNARKGRELWKIVMDAP